MLAKLFCKLFGHKWLFLTNNGAYSVSVATCERCLHRERLLQPDEVPPSSMIFTTPGIIPARKRRKK